jgi:glycosyltransferase involved in cell wall biosynthesis
MVTRYQQSPPKPLISAGSRTAKKDCTELESTEPPRFSVVVPAYNEEMYLGDCLASLAAQDFEGSLEIIVVDNNSTDGTAELARRAGVTVLRETRPGVCQARQLGTAAARGTIVVSTDADTTFSSNWLSQIDRAFRNNPRCVAVAGPTYFLDGPFWGLWIQKALFGLVGILKRRAGRVIYISATNVAFHKSMWTGYDVRLTQGGDELDLLRRLQSRGEVVFDMTNPTTTSARRMEQGVAYNLIVSFFYHYLLGYALNRMFGRRILGMAPPFRRPNPGRTGGEKVGPSVRRRARLQVR